MFSRREILKATIEGCLASAQRNVDAGEIEVVRDLLEHALQCTEELSSIDNALGEDTLAGNFTGGVSEDEQSEDVSLEDASRLNDTLISPLTAETEQNEDTPSDVTDVFLNKDTEDTFVATPIVSPEDFALDLPAISVSNIYDDLAKEKNFSLNENRE